jgi:superfamily I DNA/RNA helicase
MNDYLKQLNPAQQETVKATDGLAMIIAKAGSGKS